MYTWRFLQFCEEKVVVFNKKKRGKAEVLGITIKKKEMKKALKKTLGKSVFKSFRPDFVRFAKTRIQIVAPAQKRGTTGTGGDGRMMEVGMCSGGRAWPGWWGVRRPQARAPCASAAWGRFFPSFRNANEQK